MVDGPFRGFGNLFLREPLAACRPVDASQPSSVHLRILHHPRTRPTTERRWADSAKGLVCVTNSSCVGRVNRRPIPRSDGGLTSRAFGRPLCRILSYRPRTSAAIVSSTLGLAGVSRVLRGPVTTEHPRSESSLREPLILENPWRSVEMKALSASPPRLYAGLRSGRDLAFGLPISRRRVGRGGVGRLSRRGRSLRRRCARPRTRTSGTLRSWRCSLATFRPRSG